MKFEEVSVISNGVKLVAWLILQPTITESTSAPTGNLYFTESWHKLLPIAFPLTYACKHYYKVIYFHGNAGNIGNRLPFYYNMYAHLRVNILAVDYR